MVLPLGRSVNFSMSISTIRTETIQAYRIFHPIIAHWSQGPILDQISYTQFAKLMNVERIAMRLYSLPYLLMSASNSAASWGNVLLKKEIIRSKKNFVCPSFRYPSSRLYHDRVLSLSKQKPNNSPYHDMRTHTMSEGRMRQVLELLIVDRSGMCVVKELN